MAVWLPIIAGVAAATAAAAKAAPVLLNSKQERYNKAQMERLLKLQEEGKLGLNPQMKRDINYQLTAPTQKALQDFQTITPQAGITEGVTAGSAASQRAANLEDLGTLTAETNRRAESTVRAADQQLRQEQLSELNQRLMYQDQTKRAKWAAALSIPAEGIQGATNAYMFKNLINAGGSGETGTPEAASTAQSVWEQYQSDEEAKALILKMLEED